MPKVNAISIYVTNPEEAAAFYSNTLGFAVKHRITPEMIVLEHDGSDIVLCKADKPSTAEYPGAPGTVLGIGTDDLDEAVNRLRAANASFVFDTPQEFPGGRFVAFRDPSGNIHELLEFGGE